MTAVRRICSLSFGSRPILLPELPPTRPDPTGSNSPISQETPMFAGIGSVLRSKRPQVRILPGALCESLACAGSFRLQIAEHGSGGRRRRALAAAHLMHQRAMGIRLPSTSLVRPGSVAVGDVEPDRIPADAGTGTAGLSGARRPEAPIVAARDWRFRCAGPPQVPAVAVRLALGPDGAAERADADCQASVAGAADMEHEFTLRPWCALVHRLHANLEGRVPADAHAAQQESLLTSRVKVWAARWMASPIVR
jgi:hypothetical protein